MLDRRLRLVEDEKAVRRIESNTMFNVSGGATSERRSKGIFIASTVTGFSFDGCFDEKKKAGWPPS